MLASTPTPTSTPKRDSMDAATSPSKPSVPPAKASTRPPPTLSSLPLPVLHQIFAPLLSTTHISSSLPSISYTPSVTSEALTFTPSRPPFPLSSPLFYTDKVLSRKALTFFRAHNLFVGLELCIPVEEARELLLDSGIIFFVSGDESVARCVGHAMDVRILEKGYGVTKRVVFPGEYVPRLVDYLAERDKDWGAGHEILITVKNEYDVGRARVQGDLVEGFRVLSGISRVDVKGEVLPGYARGLERCMMGAELTGSSWLSAVKDMLHLAESSDDAEQQEEYFLSAIISLTSAYRIRPETMHSDASLAKAIQRSRWTAELGLARALHKRFTSTPHPSPSHSFAASPESAHRLLAAEKAAESALSLATDSPSASANPWVRSLPVEVVPPNRVEWFTDGERGESWYVLGVVHMALGEFLFAAGDLERAVGLLEDEGLRGEAEEAFARAREGIDWGVRPGVGLRRAAWVAGREGCEV